MASLNVSMPDAMRKWVEKRAKQTLHATPTEYIRTLIREDQKRGRERAAVDAQIDAALNDPREHVGDDAYWASLKKRAVQASAGQPVKRGRHRRAN
jgi:antitoxin ParD1/3/4